MWNIWKHRLTVSWKMFVLWNIIVGCILFSQRDHLFQYDFDSITLSIPMRTMVLLYMLPIWTLALHIFALYRDYESGKRRWLLLRKFRTSWMLCDGIIIIIQFLMLYLFFYYMARHSIETAIISTYPRATSYLQETLFAQLLQSNEFSRNLLSIDMQLACRVYVIILVLASWCHGVAVCLMKKHRSLKDWLFLCSIVLPFLFITNILCSVLLSFMCIIWYLVYAYRSWTPDQFSV